MGKRNNIGKWKNIEEEEHSWTMGNYGLQQTIYLQENENGERRLKLYRHDDPEMTILPLLSKKGTLEGLSELPHGDYTSLMEGNGYGAEGSDLISIAKTAGMEFNKADLQEFVPLED